MYKKTAFCYDDDQSAQTIAADATTIKKIKKQSNNMISYVKIKV